MPPRARTNSRPNNSREFPMPPPIRGWVPNESLVADQPGGAYLLDNWFPTSSGCRVRGGTMKYVVLPGGNPVERIWTFDSGNAGEMFASTSSGIYDISSIDNINTAPVEKVTGQTSGYYSTVQFGTPGANYLYMVNGTDDAVLYDGNVFHKISKTTGNGTPVAITGVDTKDLNFCWSFASRIFFIQKNSLSVWYLPIDSIGGEAKEFSLAGIFQDGGHIISGGRWSLDSGSGLDDKCVFISSKGEVAVYQGTNPSSASAWSKVGVYKISPPLGPNALMQSGGDLLIGCEDGIIPISVAVSKDISSLSLLSLTSNIEPAWKNEVSLRHQLPWEIVKWTEKNMMVVSLPVPAVGISEICFVANLETGAWCRYTGLNTRCICHYNDYVYYGDNKGAVFRMESGGTDSGKPYVATYVSMPTSLNMPGFLKTVSSFSTTISSNINYNHIVSASADFNVVLPSPPNSPFDDTSGNWDVAKWDVSKWDSNNKRISSRRWDVIGKTGDWIMPQIQITSGSSVTPNIEYISGNLIYQSGGVMV